MTATMHAGDMVAGFQKDGSYRADFSSLDAFVSFLDNTPSGSKINGSHGATGLPVSWYGTDSYEHANRLVREGWPEGRAALGRAVTATAPLVQARGLIRGQGFDVGGAYPMVPLAVAGEPACMVTIGDQERATRPYVKFSVSCSVSAGVGPDVIQKRGAAILAWIDALEQAGARCEVVMQFKFGYNAKDRADCIVMIKRAEEHLDLDRMAYAMTNPSYFRRHCFAWMERVPGGMLDRVGSGYGTPADVKIGEPNVVLFGHQMFGKEQWSDPSKAAAFVRQQIMQACGDLGGMLDAA